MTKIDIYDVISKFLKKNIELNDEMDLFKDLDFDSLMYVEMLAELENLVGREMDDIYESCVNPSNIGMICTYVLEIYNEKVID